MKIKRILGAALAVTCFVTAIAVPTVQGYAETFATPNALISAVLDTATTDISSPSLTAALAAAEALITTDGDKVLYDGVEVGYWYSGDSTSLYADAEQTVTLIAKSGEGYTVDPDLLKTILTDVNESISEVYIPTTSDWSKIVGKYDITLGNYTIPADQWIPLEVSDDPLAEGKIVNFSNITGIPEFSSIGNNTENKVTIQAYLVDDAGNLYIQNAMLSIGRTGSQCMGSYMDTLQTMAQWSTNFDNAPSYSTAPFVKIGLSKYNSLDTVVYPRIYATDASNSVVATLATSQVTDESTRLYKVDDASVVNTCDIANAKAYGIFYLRGSQLGTVYESNFTPWHNNHIAMFNSNSASKTVTGDATLTKRLSKIASLNPNDTITLAASGWLVNNTTDIDTYIAMQEMLNAGDTADINAVAELEPLCFNVIVPTTLPIYVAADGTVTTATNATIENKSNAAVKITGINTVAKAESGWTLVAENPSDSRDANEFTFWTSLAVNDVLSRAEVKPFTYSAELSPMTAGIDSLDLATVSVTVDWADA